jgi:hypothetical protein
MLVVTMPVMRMMAVFMLYFNLGTNTVIYPIRLKRLTLYMKMLRQ